MNPATEAAAAATVDFESWAALLPPGLPASTTANFWEALKAVEPEKAVEEGGNWVEVKEADEANELDLLSESLGAKVAESPSASEGPMEADRTGMEL
jgi:hypothetical protein